MEEMDKISAAILDKVKEEARQIIEEAEEKGKAEIETAKKNREIRFANERRRLIAGAEAEAARISAQASIGERQELLSAKSNVLSNVIAKVKKELSFVSNEANMINLIKESISGLGVSEVKIYLSKKDVAMVKGILNKNKELGSKVKAVETINCNGGVVIESIDGSLRIDNTFDTRLDMILPRVIPEISKELIPN